MPCIKVFSNNAINVKSQILYLLQNLGKLLMSLTLARVNVYIGHSIEGWLKVYRPLFAKSFESLSPSNQV